MMTASEWIAKVAGPPRTNRRLFWWSAVGLAGLLAVTGAVGNAAAADSAGGAVAGVVVTGVVPALLVLIAVAMTAVLRSMVRTDYIDEGFVVVPVIGGAVFLTLVGTALAFISQPVREFAVMGGIAEDWAGSFPFVIETAFVLFAISFVVTGVRASADDDKKEVSA